MNPNLPEQYQLRNRARGVNDPAAYLAAGGTLSNNMIPTGPMESAPVNPIAAPDAPRRYTPATSGTYGTEAGKYFAGADKTPPTADEEANIRNEELRRIQTQIDVINEAYGYMVGAEEEAGKGRMGQVRAIGARQGILGQDFGAAQSAEMETYNRKVIGAIQAEKASKIAALQSNAQIRADEKITAEKELAGKNAIGYIAFLKDKETATKEDIKSTASSGISLGELSDADYKNLIDQSGLSETGFRALWLSNMPKEQIIGSTTVGSQQIFFYQDPITKKVHKEILELGLDATGKTVQINETTGDIVVMPKDLDPNKPTRDQIEVISGKLKPKEVKLDTSVVEVEGRKLLVNNQTGATIKDLGATTVIPQVKNILYSVGLPITAVSDKGKITDSQLIKLGSGGIPPTDAQQIMDEIIKGKSLEEIRQWMRSLKVDPKVLDTFMTTIQGQEEGIINPFE